eukprot:GILJ01001320.1.p1 GENE.GILJ01001320.1~~GILJ01001320.1.p1  ORF type:complete len:515 (+),score=68.94 GILJ01001320.1:166-1710(+)
MFNFCCAGARKRPKDVITSQSRDYELDVDQFMLSTVSVDSRRPAYEERAPDENPYLFDESDFSINKDIMGFQESNEYKSRHVMFNSNPIADVHIYRIPSSSSIASAYVPQRTSAYDFIREHMQASRDIDEFVDDDETPEETTSAYVSNANLQNRNRSIQDKLRTMVSKNKRRLITDKFNLDLAYITKRIIAMGYPADGLEGVYRNKRSQVLKFLDTYHRDHYKVWNLCSEKQYDGAVFYYRVEHFPFDDHTPPPLKMMLDFCISVTDYLQEDPENIAVIHCKAGKGRTGVMIGAYLLYAGICSTPDEALSRYGEKRTSDGKGVTILSQIRWVYLFGQVVNRLRSPVFADPLAPIFRPPPVYLKKIRLGPLNGPWTLQMKVFDCLGDEVFSTKHSDELVDLRRVSLVSGKEIVDLDILDIVHLRADCRVVIWDEKNSNRKFRIWFHTAFLESHRVDVAATSIGSEQFDHVLTMRKEEIEELAKDFAHKIVDINFQIGLYFQTVPASAAHARISYT